FQLSRPIPRNIIPRTIQGRTGNLTGVSRIGFPIRFQQSLVVLNLGMPGTKSLHEGFQLGDLARAWVKVQTVICQGFAQSRMGMNSVFQQRGRDRVVLPRMGGIETTPDLTGFLPSRKLQMQMRMGLIFS